jgi:halimadienyl-diphosphate synthase
VQLESYRRDQMTILVQVPTGTITATAYDTAILAATRCSVSGSEAAFPKAVAWLLARQHPDGSWGAGIPVAHDRLVSTLAAVRALSHEPGGQAPDAVAKGIDYLRRHADDWRHSPHETVAFRLICPFLVTAVRDLGHDLGGLSFAGLPAVPAERVAGLSPIHLAHPLEAVGHHLDDQALRALPAPGGIVGCSPSATAYAWSRLGDHQLRAGPDKLLAHAPDAGVPTLAPIETFELAWTLYVLQESGQVIPNAQEALQRLRDGFRAGGAGLTADLTHTDADSTGMVILVLRRAGHDVDGLLSSLLRFERDDHFACYLGESDPSVASNARVLEVLGDHPRHAARAAKVVRYLADERVDGAYWRDKWHISPYYATAQVVNAARGHAPALLTGTLDWVLTTQRDDGSWGSYQGTLEETAHAVLMLRRLASAAYNRPVDPAVPLALSRAGGYLRQSAEAALADPGDPVLAPAQWLGKGLYSSRMYFRGLLLTALALTASTE